MIVDILCLVLAFAAGVILEPRIMVWLKGAEQEAFDLRDRALQLEKSLKAKL